MAFTSLKLEMFLPAYSGIDVDKNDPFYSFYSADITEPYKKEFPISTYLKKEFNELKLQPNEPVKNPNEPFTPLNHQLFISRFLSPHTPYDKLLIFHELGSGKTCLASLLSETAKKTNPNLGETLILVRNELLERNFLNEIATKCTNNKYKPEETEEKINKKTGEKISTKLTERQYEGRLKSNISQNYHTATFERFAKRLENEKDDYIKEQYSNRVIIIDEVHNLRPTKKRQDSLSIYDQISRLLHLVQNCKIILMSATPMRDTPFEISPLLNLLLPADKQFTTNKEEFQQTYFEQGQFVENKKKEFKSRIRGLISYVRSTGTDVKKIYEGTVLQSMRKFPLVEVKMSDLQTKAYNEAYKKDSTSNQDFEEKIDDDSVSGLSDNSQQASMFVAPDGSYGSEMEKNKWLIVPKKEKLTEEEKGKGKRKKRPARPLHERLTKISTKLKDYIGDGNNEEKLDKLSILSCKFAGVIRNILTNPQEKAFVYCDFVEGSGVNLFAALLELFGFTHVALPESDKKIDISKYKKKKQFILITGKFPSAKQASYLINNVYNDSENKYGDYIQIIVASRIVGEGLSFKHTRQFHNLSPWWNEARMQQTQGRVVRAFAHDVFTNPLEKYIKIFRWCAIPGSNIPSIDLKMYKRAEDKDFPIKQIERLLKEASVDCPLNVKRNMRPDLNAEESRECDYSTCIYQCDNIPPQWYLSDAKQPSLILDSFNFYYDDKQIEAIKQILRELFRVKFAYDFYEFVDLLPDITELIIIRALRDMIYQFNPIINKFGMISYLKESNNFYFLTNTYDIYHIPNSFLLSTYSSSPILKEEMKFEDYVTYFENMYLPEKLAELQSIDDKDVLEYSFKSFSKPIQEKLLESFIKAEVKNIDTNKDLRRRFLKIYEKFIEKIDNTTVSTLLYEKILRCFNEKDLEWSDCSDIQVNRYREGLKEKKETKTTGNPYGYYGIIDKDNKFKISLIDENVRVAVSTGKFDKRKKKEKSPGQACGTGMFIANNLKSLLIRFYDIAEKHGHVTPSVVKFITGVKNKKIIEKCDVKKVSQLAEAAIKKPIYPPLILPNLESFSREKLQEYCAILLAKAKESCQALREFFANNNLLLEL